MDVAVVNVIRFSILWLHSAQFFDFANDSSNRKKFSNLRYLQGLLGHSNVLFQLLEFILRDFSELSVELFTVENSRFDYTPNNFKFDLTDYLTNSKLRIINLNYVYTIISYESQFLDTLEHFWTSSPTNLEEDRTF